MVRALVVPLLLSLGLAGSGLAQEGPKAGVESGERALRRASFLAPDSAFAVSMAGVEGQEDVSGAVGAGWPSTGMLASRSARTGKRSP